MGPNLPDLDQARALQPSEPVIPSASSSNQPCADCTTCTSCDPGTLNHPPISITAGPYYGQPGQSVTFVGSGSYDADPNDNISSYQWNFGDAQTVTGISPQHIYSQAGTYNITLTVTDQHGATSSSTTTATINTSSSQSSSPTGQGNDAVFVSQSVPTEMHGGQKYPVSVTMRNNGTNTWTSANLYRLGMDNATWGIQRVALPATVLPGQQVTFNFIVTPSSGSLGEGLCCEDDGAPPAIFDWQMVQDGVQWFGGHQNMQVTIDPPEFQPGGGDAPYSTGPNNLFSSRLAAWHRTGEPGEDLYSGNYNWSLPVLGLAGRSGMDLGLSLSYNSFVWTKVYPTVSPLMPPRFQQKPSITFDADRGFPGPGFRLGFPSIQGPFNNDQANNSSSYLLILPSGKHAELRATSVANTYESVDSSYLQLITASNGNFLLRNTDGTQMTFRPINGEYRCTGITDRNGNHITVNYGLVNNTDNTGRITSIVDTLNRTINFSYDANFRIQTITQNWIGGQHTWATFRYADQNIQTNFTEADNSPIIVSGLPSNNTVSMLSQIGLDDGSRYNFTYTSWGQINQITHTAEAGNQLSSISYNLPGDSSSQQSDCPRFTQRQDFASDWNKGAPAITSYLFGATAPNGQMTSPDGTVYKEFYEGTAKWQQGLVTRTQIFSSENLSTPKKTMTTGWSQDDPTLSYLFNPHPVETIISDSDGNSRRTTLEYTSYGLLFDTFEWKPGGQNGWMLLRRTHTNYNLSDVYVSRRIIGLPQAQYVFSDENYGQKLYSKVTYEYDSTAFNTSLGADVTTATQHETTYNTNFVVGRGNLTGVRKWDVTNEGSSHLTSIGYNTAGSPIYQTDPANHQVKIRYNDAGTGGGNTYAYPTTVTDADGNDVLTEYRYDFGARTRLQTPRPQGATLDPVQTFDYDSAGRIKLTTNLVNQAYTHWVYPKSMTYVNSFTTIQENAGEAFSIQVFDGAGNVRATAGDFPNSTGHYRGQYSDYDVVTRLSRQIRISEINNTWYGKGDDYPGEVWPRSTQTYDWKGRPLVTTNVDGLSSTASYGGCGCAGGEVVTVTDEVGRQQKIYHDTLGRVSQTIVYTQDNPRNVYLTTTNTYNALDQTTGIIEQGQSGTTQTTTMEYDGYSRLLKRHLPEQQADSANLLSSDHTTYQYNADDTINEVTDARGVIARFTYNARHLVTGVSYDKGSISSVGTAPGVTYDYDGAGNRISMLDGQGSVSYVYDALSRLKSETRTFTALNRSYQLSYDYALGGALKTLTYPSLGTISYDHDAIGRVTSVYGSSFAGVSQYASGITYRAWGAPKSVSYGDNGSATVSYNARMQPTQYLLTSPPDSTGISPTQLREQFQYYADGRLQQLTDLDDSSSRHFSRQFSYDHVGRIKSAGGVPASGSQTGFLPFKQSYSYDEFDNMTERFGSYYYQPNTTDGGTFQNSRRQDWTYDANGLVTHSPTSSGSVTSYRDWKYDAAGRMLQTIDTSTSNNTTTISNYSAGYEGDGQLVYESTQQQNPSTTNTSYIVRSSLNGQVVTRLDGNGITLKNIVSVDGLLTAVQNPATSSLPARIDWSHTDPHGLTEATTISYTSQAVFDPLGNYIPFQTTPNPFPSGGTQYFSPSYAGMGVALGFTQTSSNSTCTLDGRPSDCYKVVGMMIHGQIGGGTIVFSDKASLVFAGFGSFTGGVGKGHWERKDITARDDDGSNSINKGEILSSSRGIPVFVSDSFDFGFSQEPQDSDMPISPGDKASSCEKEVYALARTPADSVGMTKANAGLLMAYNAVQLGLNAKRLPVDGFKDELVRPYQLGDVYKHIRAHAGAMLLRNKTPDYGILKHFGKYTDWSGKSGYQIDQEETEKDRLQAIQDFPGHFHEEGEVELRDDEAGRQVGNAIGQAWDGNMSLRQLQDKLRSILCK